MILADFMCPEHGRFESFEHSPLPDAVSCPTCGAMSAWAPSPLALKVPSVSVTTTGRSHEERPPNTLDTRELGDGMPMTEWRAKQREKRIADTLDALHKDPS